MKKTSKSSKSKVGGVRKLSPQQRNLVIVVLVVLVGLVGTFAYNKLRDSSAQAGRPVGVATFYNKDGFRLGACLHPKWGGGWSLRVEGLRPTFTSMTRLEGRSYDRNGAFLGYSFSDWSRDNGNWQSEMYLWLPMSNSGDGKFTARFFNPNRSSENRGITTAVSVAWAPQCPGA